jgi:hypothetical protein
VGLETVAPRTTGNEPKQPTSTNSPIRRLTLYLYQSFYTKNLSTLSTGLALHLYPSLLVVCWIFSFVIEIINHTIQTTPSIKFVADTVVAKEKQ